MQVRRSGFTLIELLVVIAIIAILAAILFPVFARAKEAGKQTVCSQHMRQVGFAIDLYADDYSQSLPITWDWGGGRTREEAWCRPTSTWKQLVKPYSKTDELYICPSYAGPHVDCRDYLDKPVVIWTGEYGVNNFAYVDYFTENDANGGGYYEHRWAKVYGMDEPAATIFVSENQDGDWISEPEPMVCRDPISGHTIYTEDPGIIAFRHGGKNSANAAFVDGHAKCMTREQFHANDCYFWWRRKGNLSQ
jgi:prepilin-type N-terminal cleavage/methylation domain-containing protein/prepilin-type processing-associated H-X9-DG protein